MSFTVPICKKVTVVTFAGDRGQIAADFLRALDDEKNRGGQSPSRIDCLLYAGHTGVSLDDGKTIYGFNPDGVGLATWDLISRLKKGEKFPGIVLDDTQVFATARAAGVNVLKFDVILPEPDHQVFEQDLNSEFRKSRFWYGFPSGNGECNCTTWLERLGLPLLTGRMDEFVSVRNVARQVSRRFGECV